MFNKFHKSPASVCALCFATFAFAWLYWFQADLLAVAQHALSGGTTHYDRTIGAVVIVITLQLLQTAVGAFVRLPPGAWAMTYAPSFLALAFLSDITTRDDSDVTVGAAWWLIALLLLAWVAAVHYTLHTPHSTSSWQTTTGRMALCPLSSLCSLCNLGNLWGNLLQMGGMMLVVAAAGNTNAVLHYRAHAETALMRGDSSEAMLAGWESMETDTQLTMLRAYALSREGLLPEMLFRYPVTGTGSDLLPMRHKPMMLPADSIWRHLGAKPAFPMTAQAYYRLLEDDSVATKAVADYVLCGLLIDRDLKTFARLLPRYYGDSLPCHYREAMELYNCLYPSSAQSSSQRLHLLENYRHTYWRYFACGQ